VNSYTWLIWIAVLAIIFFILWRKGSLLRFSHYVAKTREELRKCTWPTKEELKSSTWVIIFGSLLIGLYTVGVDFVISSFIRWVI